jgi:ketosteroid isomerase-like protein
MNEIENEVWQTVQRQLDSIFSKDVTTYQETTAEDLSLYEWFVTPNRQDGLPFHFFMIEHGWAGTPEAYRYDLMNKRLQLYGDTAIVTYTFMLTQTVEGVLSHRSHNESRVLVKGQEGWQIVHVHKSPGWTAPYSATEG